MTIPLLVGLGPFRRIEIGGSGREGKGIGLMASVGEKFPSRLIDFSGSCPRVTAGDICRETCCFHSGIRREWGELGDESGV